MNYLSHYVYNHRICSLPCTPPFAVGVVLPDLWLRFSRTRRIRWKAVRAAQPTDPADIDLRAGLLNHVAADCRFHGLPLFLDWQLELRRGVNTNGLHTALAEFLAHMSIELALDVALLREDPGLIDEFYSVVGANDLHDFAARVGNLAAVDTAGLGEILDRFVQRRFLRHYLSPAGLADVVRIVLGLADIPMPPDHVIAAMLAAASAVVSPHEVWTALGSTPP